jgi:hypothetical protein
VVGELADESGSTPLVVVVRANRVVDIEPAAWAAELEPASWVGIRPEQIGDRVGEGYGGTLEVTSGVTSSGHRELRAHVAGTSRRLRIVELWRNAADGGSEQIFLIGPAPPE